MIESPLLIRMVDVLIVDHPTRHAVVALAFLQMYLVPQLLNGRAWRPPHVVLVAALAWFLLSAVDIALGWRLPADKRDVIAGLWVAAALVGGWACVALVLSLPRLVSAIRQDQALTPTPEARG